MISLGVSPFISITLPNLLDSEEQSVELMKDAALYVSSRFEGPCVFILPEDHLWVVEYDYLVDSYSCLKKHLLYILNVMVDAEEYFAEYYLKLEANSDNSDSKKSDNSILEDEAFYKRHGFLNIHYDGEFY